MNDRNMRRLQASAAILGTMVENFSAEDTMILLGMVAGERVSKEEADFGDRIYLVHAMETSALIAAKLFRDNN